MMILSILNWLIYRAITRARTLHNTLKSGNSHRRDNTMATVLTAIVFVFFICHLPKAALNIYEVGMVRTVLKSKSCKVQCAGDKIRGEIFFLFWGVLCQHVCVCLEGWGEVRTIFNGKLANIWLIIDPPVYCTILHNIIIKVKFDRNCSPVYCHLKMIPK